MSDWASVMLKNPWGHTLSNEQLFRFEPEALNLKPYILNLTLNHKGPQALQQFEGVRNLFQQPDYQAVASVFWNRAGTKRGLPTPAASVTTTPADTAEGGHMEVDTAGEEASSSAGPSLLQPFSYQDEAAIQVTAGALGVDINNHICFLAFFWVLPVWQLLVIALSMYVFLYLVYNSYDFRIGERTLSALIANVSNQTVCPRIADYTFILWLAEMVLVLVLLFLGLRPLILRVLASLIKRNVDLSTIRRFSDVMPARVRVLMFLSNPVENAIRTVFVVTGGGKTTTAMLASPSKIALLGGAAVDKDALTSSRMREEATSWGNVSVQSSMQSADNMLDDVDDEEEPFSMTDYVRWLFGKEIVADSTAAKRAMHDWFMARASEIYHRGLECGVADPKVLVLVHSPEDLLSADLPMQSYRRG